ncbi:MAG: VWA domain-containing protein [Lachnospiraceae bacterium]|nr:VWA domain-containing protein [Lachnospiraceae bacterium]
MGGGYWRREDFAMYSRTMGRTVRADGHIDTSRMHGAQDMYRAWKLDPLLDPFMVTRECCDSPEHPATVPVILALDVTGSMGGALLKTAASLNVIMQDTLNEYKDVEFMVMGIGDLAYDRAPVQISQFESDIRVAEHLDRIWFERGGGGNRFESYTAAWYMGLHHTKLDCWKRGKKGVIITLGDEPLNPYLPGRRLAQITGDRLFGDVRTGGLYRRVREKFDVFHVAVDDPGDSFHHYEEAIRRSFGPLLGERLLVSTLDMLPRTILGCLRECGVGAAGTRAVKALPITERPGIPGW